MVAVGKDAVLWHPEIQHGANKDQTGQHQMEMSPDQAAPKHSGQHISCQHQGGIQEPEEEFPCCSQLRGHPVEFLQADLWSQRGLFGLQIHDEGLFRTASLLLLLPLCLASLSFSSGSGPAVLRVRRASEHMVDKNNPPTDLSALPLFLKTLPSVNIVAATAFSDPVVVRRAAQQDWIWLISPTHLMKVVSRLQEWRFLPQVSRFNLAV